MIKPPIQLLLVLFLLLIVSCNCDQRSLGNGKDNYGAELTTDTLKLRGSVSGRPGLELILEVGGEISYNSIEEEARLVLIAIPQGADIKAAAEKLKNDTTPQTLDTCISLAVEGGKGLACYGKEVAAKHTGGVSVVAYTKKSPLPPDSVYEGYLALRTKRGTVFYATQGKPFKTPSVAKLPQVKVTEVEAKKVTKDVQLELKGTIDNLSHNSQGGVLLIEVGDTKPSPTELMAAQIVQEKPLSSNPKLKLLADHPAVIIYPQLYERKLAIGSLVGSADIDMKLIDEGKVLKRGGTYQVYYYVLDKDNNYVISQENKRLTIPKPKIKLAIKEASPSEIIQELGGDGKLTYILKGDIKKMNMSTTAGSVMGFLFSEGEAMNKKDAISNISRLLSPMPGISELKKVDTSLIYLAGEVNDKDGLQEFSLEEKVTDSNLPKLELGKSYKTYFWLKDGNEIYVSKNNLELKIPSVKVKAINWTEGKEEESGKYTNIYNLFFTAHIEEITNLEDCETGFLFMKKEDSLTVNDLNKLLSKYKVEEDKKERKKRENELDIYEKINDAKLLFSLQPGKSFHKEKLLQTKPEAYKVFIVDRGLEYLEPESDYKSYYFVLGKGAIFYKAGLAFHVGELNEKGPEPLIAEDEEGNIYELYKQNAGPGKGPKAQYEIYKQVSELGKPKAKQRINMPSTAYNPQERALIEALVKQFFQLPDGTTNPAVLKKFLNPPT